MTEAWLDGDARAQLDTPVVVVDLDRVDATGTSGTGPRVRTRCAPGRACGRVGGRVVHRATITNRIGAGTARIVHMEFNIDVKGGHPVVYVHQMH